MKIIETKIKEISKTESLVTLILADNDDLELATENMSFTFRVKYGERPLLQAIQAKALSRAQFLADKQRRAILGLPSQAPQQDDEGPLS